MIDSGFVTVLCYLVILTAGRIVAGYYTNAVYMAMVTMSYSQYSFLVQNSCSNNEIDGHLQPSKMLHAKGQNIQQSAQTGTTKQIAEIRQNTEGKVGVT